MFFGYKTWIFRIKEIFKFWNFKQNFQFNHFSKSRKKDENPLFKIFI
jgi:hypothetical protein